MDNKVLSSNIEKRQTYLDELSFGAFRRLLFVHGLKQATILDAIKPRQRLWFWLLKTQGVSLLEADFVAGHLKTEKGECVYMAARRLAGEIALIAAKGIVKHIPLLDALNERYGRNTIRLYVAKQLHLYIEHWTVRTMVAQSLSVAGRAEIWLKRPKLFDEKLLVEAFPEANLDFYSCVDFCPGRLFVWWILNVAWDIKLISGWGRREREPLNTKRPNKPSILTLQEDAIRADRSLRGQPHWLDVDNPPESFNTYLVKLDKSDQVIKEDLLTLSRAGLKILSTAAFGHALKAMRNEKVIARVRRDRKKAIRAAFLGRGFTERYFLLRVAKLLRQAELMGALVLWLNSRVFLIGETYYTFADAMQLVAPDVGVCTVAYQYSNMGSISPMMMSTADKFLIFGDMHKALYQWDGIGPQEFLTTGYLYDGIASLVREKSKAHREILHAAGADFIVCYFDESVQQNRWGLVSEQDHLHELHVLARAVLTDHSFGAVIKTQFVRNSPSRLYPGDDLIQAAKETGRYLELLEGIHRNTIYPTEAALVADLCIGHKIGASAALEAAVAGVRTVLLDPYGTRTLWDDIYAKAAIEYASIDALMETIARYRSGDPTEKALGDWAPILPYFDPYRDGKAADRLRSILEKAIQ